MPFSLPLILCFFRNNICHLDLWIIIVEGKHLTFTIAKWTKTKQISQCCTLIREPEIRSTQRGQFGQKACSEKRRR